MKNKEYIVFAKIENGIEIPVYRTKNKLRMFLLRSIDDNDKLRTEYTTRLIVRHLNRQGWDVAWKVEGTKGRIKIRSIDGEWMKLRELRAIQFAE